MAQYPIQLLLQEMRQAADAVQAAYMAGYMKDQFAFLGITAPARKAMLQQFLQAHGKPTVHQWEQVVKSCWQEAEREYQYLAIDLLIKYKKYFLPEQIYWFEAMITDRSWWDTVDLLASHAVGSYLLSYPDKRNALLDRWLATEHLWLQRSCLLFQLKYKAQTDADLLSQLILDLKDHPDFFIRKAIGWALREYSKTNPDFVLQFVDQHNLATLSQKEALKHINKKR